MAHPLFDELWDYGDPAATELRLREAELQLKTQLARTMGLRKRFDEAHALLDAVDAALEASSEEMPCARVRSLLERGRALRSGGDPARARPLFEQAWELAQAAELDYYAVDAAHMVAIATDVLEDQLAWTARGLEVAEASTDEAAQGWVGALTNNLGWAYHDAGRHEDALDTHQRGWDWRRARSPEAKGTRIAKWAVAKCLRFCDRPEEAIAMQRELLEEYSRVEPGGEGFVCEELGELLLTRDPDEARARFARAHELLSAISWVADDDPERLARIGRLGGIESG